MSAKIKSLQSIHLAFCAGVILFYLFIGEISMENLNISNVDGSSLVYLALPVLAFVLSDFLFKNQLKQVDIKPKTEDNFAVYQQASIVRWAVLEGAAMLIALFKPDFLIFGILLIVYLILVRPTETRMKKDLETL